MRDFLERRFGLAERGTSVRTEALAGATTFLALSYILFVQPAVMAAAGIDAEVALFATCVASAAACLLMGVLANYPIALAPAMGHNFFFAFTACGAVAAGGFGLTWQQGLAAVFLSGALFLALAAVRFRERILEALPPSLQHAIAAGIGLLVAGIGLQWGGLIQAHPVTLVTLGDFRAPPAVLALCGLGLTLALVARRVRGALLLGILATLGAGVAAGVVARPERFLAARVEGALLLDELDFAGLFVHPRVVETLLTLFILDVFDTIGTLVGVCSRAGLMRGARLPRAGRALFSDAAGTVAGAALGTSTITSYVESSAGVAAGGRTGLANVFTAGLFLLALPLQPLFAVVGRGVEIDGRILHPVLAPALIVVGALMAKSAAKVEWDDPVVATPCLLTMLVMPLSFSITEGIAFGIVGFSLASLASGRPGRVSWIVHVLAAALLARWILL